MTFLELVDAVVVLTKRPDKGDLISLRLREATQFAHCFDFWRHDLREVPIEYPDPLFTGAVDVATYLPGYRKISYWRKFDPLTGTVGAYLKPVEPDDLFDRYRYKKVNVYYFGGIVLNWFSSTSDKGHIIGYWRLPIVTEVGYDSWIARDHPWLLINYAAGNVFASLGQKETGADHRGQAITQLQELQTNEIESAGR